jgi:hypothetical protein
MPGYPKPHPPPAPAPKPPPAHPPPGPPPKDQFTPYDQGSQNSAHDQALAIIEQFLSIMGWPGGVNENALMLQMLQQGLELSPEQAYNWLYTQMSQPLQKANPNAEFGMTRDAYLTTLNGLKDEYQTLTGTSDIPSDVLRMAIDQQWTTSELTQFLKTDARYSNPANLPWLQQGMSYKDVSNQFYQTYGKNPTAPAQLASWFNFRTGAQQVGTGTMATATTGVGPAKGLSESEVR